MLSAPRHRLQRQRGVSMVEMILAMGLAVLMIGSLTSLLMDAQLESKAQRDAELQLAFQQAAGEYFLAHRSALLEAMETGTDEDGLCRSHLDVDARASVDLDLHTCRIDVTTLQTARMLPDTLAPTNAMGERLLAIYRLLLDEEGEATRTADMVVVAVSDTGEAQARDNRRYQRSIAAASAMGSTGGVIADGERGNCRASASDAVYQACGAGWQIDLAAYLSATEIASLSASLSHSSEP